MLTNGSITPKLLVRYCLLQRTGISRRQDAHGNRLRSVSPDQPGLRSSAAGLGRRRRSLRLTTSQAAMPEVQSAAPNADSNKADVSFSNSEDPDCTVIKISGENAWDLLMQVTGVFSALDISVSSANINTEEGQVFDEFRVTCNNGDKIPESLWDELRTQLLSLLSTSEQSSRPAIYGVAAAAELKRLNPLTKSEQRGMEGDAAALEVAAAEMAAAAASLVSIERDIVSLSARKGDTNLVVAKENERRQASALLERKMAAMEAVLAARRTPMAQPEPDTVMPPSFLPPSMVSGTGPGAGNGYEIILQGFNWESHKQAWYKVLSSQASAIAAAGFTAVWMPPHTDSVSPQGYLPRDLYDLNSCYGSEAELRSCLQTLHENGLKAIADIVINHRCAHFQSADGKWNKYGGRLAWDQSAICANNPLFGGQGNWKPFEDYPAAPNLDHAQDKVRKDLSEWLRYLRTSIGFDGWRFDYVKGYDGKYIKDYVDASVPLMAFGEYWDTCAYTDGVLNYNQDAHRQRTIDWCDSTGATAAAFDFTTKGILQEAVSRREYWRLIDSQGRPPGLLGMWSSRAVTFLENHDTGSTLRHWPFPGNHLAEGYAYLLTHPGTPCVFYDHFFFDASLQEKLSALIRIRKAKGVTYKSTVLIRKATNDLYAATIDNKIAMKIGPGNWSPNDQKLDCGQKDWNLEVSGVNFAVWTAII